MPGRFILTLNAGSSSIKFAAYRGVSSTQLILRGQVERIGGKEASLSMRRGEGAMSQRRGIAARTHEEAGRTLAAFVVAELGSAEVGAIGHRVVHGGLSLLEHQRITPGVLEALRAAVPLDRSHLPSEIALIEIMAGALPAVPQVACFDTAFHREMPHVNRLLAIPRSYLDAGVRRLGFHGLSYEYLLEQLNVLDAAAAAGRVIFAHLGSGASLAAVAGGRAIDTTMAFTPTAGLVMAARPGDIDPGLLVHMMREENLSADGVDDLITRRCGMAGMSQSGGDMRDLLARRAVDQRAADAVDLFCHQAKKQIASMAASLGGVETLVFSGGVGEHAAPVRAAICDGLAFLGVRLDGPGNEAGRPVISTGESLIRVRIIPTDEEIVIARAVRAILGEFAPEGV
jgi:acetate kinase